MDDVQDYQNNTVYQEGSGNSPYDGGEYGDESPYPADSPVYADAPQYQEGSGDYQYDNGEYGDESPYPADSPVYADAPQYQEGSGDYQNSAEGYGESYGSYQEEGAGYDQDYSGMSWWEDTRIAGGLIWLTHLVGLLGIALGILGIITAGGSIKDSAYQGLHYAVPLMVGAAGILLFARYSIFHRSDAIRSDEDPDESYFQKEAGFFNLAIGIVALIIFFGGWGTGAEVAIALTYAVYSTLALVFFFLHRVENDELDRSVILNMVIRFVCIGFLYFLGFAAAAPANLSPF